MPSSDQMPRYDPADEILTHWLVNNDDICYVNYIENKLSFFKQRTITRSRKNFSKELFQCWPFSYKYTDSFSHPNSISEYYEPPLHISNIFQTFHFASTDNTFDKVQDVHMESVRFKLLFRTANTIKHSNLFPLSQVEVDSGD